MKKRINTPPAWMIRFIEWYCAPRYVEDLLGDLQEFYLRNSTRGKYWADFNYLLDTIKFMRPYLMQKVKLNNKMTSLNLLQNYFKTAFRSIRRNKLFSGINLFGLGAAMTICLLMIAYIAELLSYDNFHQHRDRIYRVTNFYEGHIEDGWRSQFASTSLLVGKKMKEEVTGLEHVATIRRNFHDDLRKGENAINIQGYYTEDDFWDIFSFELIQGNSDELLTDPRSLVITNSVAKKLFGERNPIGQIVEGRKDSYTVTGVVQDVPSTSHMQFEAIAPLSSYMAKRIAEGEDGLYDWNNMWSNYVYFTLAEEGNLSSVQESLDRMAKEENARTDRYSIDLSLQNLNDIVPGAGRSNEIGPNFDWDVIYLLSGLTLIVMLSAAFNYTNLSIARSLRRSKEVGIRKVIGASRFQVISQFLTEALVIAIIALVFSWLLFFGLRPHFIALFDDAGLTLAVNGKVFFYAFIFAIGTGLIAGILPAIFLSKLRAIQILRDATTKRLFKGVSLRRVLIVFQLTLSMGFVIATTIAYRQYKYSINFDLGYQTDNIINLSLQGNEHQLLVNELEQIPEISKISKSAMVMSVGEIWAEYFFYNDPLDSANLFVNYVDRSFTDLHDFEFLAGGSFPFEGGAKDSARFVIVDQLTLQRFEVGEPQEAIGEILTMTIDGDKHKLEVTGVIADFQYGQINSKKKSVALVQGTADDFQYVNLLANTQNPIELMGKLDDAFRKIDSLHPLSAQFYDERIRRAYEDFSKSFQIFSVLSVLAITIALMGFLGITVFTMETRIKEISVRKVLGATEKQLVYLLSRGFVWMILVAAALATPLTYLLFSQVILLDFANRISIGPVTLASGIFTILLCAIPIVIWQTTKTARMNPAENLRND